jgi:radical SAM protein with 4Fe4S-binding SPASM domain
MRKIAWIKSRGSELGAIQTTSKYSLSYPRQVIDAYLEAGLNYLFIRPLTPLGMAQNTWHEIGYQAEEFVAFYTKCIKYILSLNKNGIFFREGHATIWLRKILGNYQENYMELRSPCGASVGQIAFYCNGNIYTCDEGRMLAEMGNEMFLLGNVNSSAYTDLMDSTTTKATCSASILETIPGCCDCVYQPYCGTCPVINLAIDGNIFPRSAWHYRCKIYSGMLDTLFSCLEHENSEEKSIFQTWL